MLSAKRWRLERVLQLLMALFASMFLGIVLVSLLSATHWLKENQRPLVAIVVSILSFHGIALVLTCRLLREEGMTWNEAFGFLSPRIWRTLLLALLVALAVIPIALSLADLSARFMNLVHLKPMVQDPVQILQSAQSLPMRVLIGILAIGLAPAAEEVVFRGLIYPTLKQLGFPRLALWGTSLFFACIHFNLAVLLPLTFLAVIWTMLYETTGNLLAPIFAHSLFNLWNFLLVVTLGPTAVVVGAS
jgi:membrane protease YdiL (CAAX protease family)